MSSHTACFHVLASCLDQALQVGKASSGFMPDNASQAAFLDMYYGVASADLPLFKDGEFATLAAFDADTINTFLADHGFQITLDPFTDADDFGVAAVMNVLVTWETPGEEDWIKIDGNYVKAAKLEQVTTTVTERGTTIAHIPCEGGKDTLHICVAPDGEVAPFDTTLSIAKLVARMASAPSTPGTITIVKFPMVDLDQEVDISWFIGLGFNGTGPTGRFGFYRIVDAKQQTKLRMNHLGARAESAAAMTSSLECCMSFEPPTLVIDKPFYVWITREGQTLPIFAGYIDREDWKSPAAL